MRSIKPGRGPSALGAAGSLVAIVFGIGWTIVAHSITRNSPFPVVGTIFPLFGVLFVVVGIVQLVYNLTNTVAKDRMSVLDVTDDAEEPDPLNRRFGAANPPAAASAPAAPPPAAAVQARLQRLDELKAAGAITDAEYETQRMRILDEI